MVISWNPESEWSEQPYRFRYVKSANRKRKLQKRGVPIWWSVEFGCWIWKMYYPPYINNK